MHKKKQLKSKLLPKQLVEDKSSTLLQGQKSGHQSAFSLCPNEIQIWYAKPQAFNNAVIQERFRSWLSPEELTVLEGFRFERHRHTYLVAHALTRAALSLSLEIKPSAWQFHTNTFGKPFIAPPLDTHGIHFNLSHTEGMVAVTMTKLGAIGIDVESINRETSILELASDILSTSEHLDLKQQSKAEQHARLLKYWTLKEAFVKATGFGLTSGLQSHAFDLEAQPHPRLLTQTDTQPTDWLFRQFTLPSGHILALAHHQPDTDNTFVSLKEALWLQESAELG